MAVKLFDPLKEAVENVVDDAHPYSDGLYIVSREHIDRLRREFENFFVEPIDTD